MEILTRQAEANDFAAIKKLYERWGYKGGLKGDDQIFVATWQNQIIGVVRISFETGYHILRGMYVKSEFQRKGIGSLLLGKANDWLQQKECFCVPFATLRQFYGQIGFEEIKDNEAPGFLVERSQKYKKDGHDVVIMHRQSA